MFEICKGWFFHQIYNFLFITSILTPSNSHFTERVVGGSGKKRHLCDSGDLSSLRHVSTVFLFLIFTWFDTSVSVSLLFHPSLLSVGPVGGESLALGCTITSETILLIILLDQIQSVESFNSSCQKPFRMFNGSKMTYETHSHPTPATDSNIRNYKYIFKVLNIFVMVILITAMIWKYEFLFCTKWLIDLKPFFNITHLTETFISASILITDSLPFIKQ